MNFSLSMSTNQEPKLICVRVTQMSIGLFCDSFLYGFSATLRSLSLGGNREPRPRKTAEQLCLKSSRNWLIFDIPNFVFANHHINDGEKFSHTSDDRNLLKFVPVE